jgi:hypothetical protein
MVLKEINEQQHQVAELARRGNGRQARIQRSNLLHVVRVKY